MGKDKSNHIFLVFSIQGLLSDHVNESGII